MSLPVFINQIQVPNGGQGDVGDGNFVLPHQHYHQRDMANSAQNFNPHGRQGRISINQAADNGMDEGGALLGPNGEKSTRNETLQPMSGKPNSAVLK